jgi:uncharacterized protein YgbK (DUF1537 family)
MIAVIADDLTGAAEMGGIGIRHGLRTEIRTAVGTSADADLLVIAADSRSKHEKAAVEEMTTITRELRLLKPEWVYKKTDSVLRGHVMAELKVHLENLDFRNALLIPANPSLGRIIRDGQYYLNGEPIHKSSFSCDPEFPILSSDIQDMLHTKNQPVPIRKPTEKLPVRGIIVGEAASTDDLHAWAQNIPPQALLAGAAGFFSAILDNRHATVTATIAELIPPILYISGSTFENNRNLIRQQAANGGVTYMSDTPFQQKVLDDLKDYGKAIVAIEPVPQSQSALELRLKMARELAPLLRQEKTKEIFIEGGSTAYAILQQMGWRRFFPEQEFAQGVVRMSVPGTPGLHITVKPGSYAWPQSTRFY